MDRTLRENQALWDAWTRIHVPSPFYDVASFRDGTRPIRLSEYERDEVGPVDGKTLLHLQCHFGMDTLSWARLGATVTGADFSERGIRWPDRWRRRWASRPHSCIRTSASCPPSWTGGSTWFTRHAGR